MENTHGISTDSPKTDKVNTHIQQNNMHKKICEARQKTTLASMTQGERQDNNLQLNLHHKKNTKVAKITATEMTATEQQDGVKA